MKTKGHNSLCFLYRPLTLHAGSLVVVHAKGRGAGILDHAPKMALLLLLQSTLGLLCGRVGRGEGRGERGERGVGRGRDKDKCIEKC